MGNQDFLALKKATLAVVIDETTLSRRAASSFSRGTKQAALEPRLIGGTSESSASSNARAFSSHTER
jgi:hypothetical protein